MTGPVIFVGGEKGEEVVEKLNAISQAAGDIEQNKTAAQQAVVTVGQLVVLANAAKDTAQAIAVSEIENIAVNFSAVKVNGKDVALTEDILTINTKLDELESISVAMGIIL